MVFMKAVLFDLDGVLVDGEKAHYHATRLALEEQGIHFTYKQYLQYFPGVTDEEALAWFLRKPRRAVKWIARRKHELFSEIFDQHIVSFPNTIAAAKMLKRKGYRLVLATSAVRPEAMAFLNAFRLKPLFHAIVSAEDVKKGKPDPQIYLLAAKKAKAKPSECVVVEDSVAGVAAAKAAGMRCVALLHTYPHKLLRKADAIVSDRGAGGAKKLFKAIVEQ